MKISWRKPDLSILWEGCTTGSRTTALVEILCRTRLFDVPYDLIDSLPYSERVSRPQKLPIASPVPTDSE